MKFLLDANLPPTLARALHALSSGVDPGVDQVIPLRDKFAPDTKDPAWLSALAREGDWAVISQDGFNKSDIEKALIERAGLMVFVLDPAWGKQQYWAKCVQLIRWWPKILSIAALSTSAVRVPWNTTSKTRSLRL